MGRVLTLLLAPLSLSGCLEIGDTEPKSGSGGDASSVGGGSWTGGASGVGGSSTGGTSSGGTSATGGTGATGATGGTGGTGGLGGSGGNGGSGAGCALELENCSVNGDCCPGRTCKGDHCCVSSLLGNPCVSVAGCCTGDACEDVQGLGKTCCASVGKSCLDTVCCGSNECSPGTQQCCAPASGGCNFHGDCCNNMECHGSQCCVKSGAQCENSAECCDLALCIDGKCQ